MHDPLAFRPGVPWLAAVLCLLPSAGSAAPPEAAPAIYHADPGHLWNRLHQALFVRIGPDGRQYGQDRLEPLLWSQSRQLLEGRSHDRAVAILEEFLADRGERRIDDPLRRAVLQRDLWLIFNWLEGQGSPPKRLRASLAAVIGRLAQSPESIRKLPDNYADAVASGRFARKYDPERPDAPYLPPDLFAPDGPWVCVGRPDGPAAPQHLREDGGNAFTNSAFLVFLRLPGGRSAAVDYLTQLRAFTGDLLIRADAGQKKAAVEFVPNPELPQLPKGTEVALVRRALLIDASHRLAATTLTESVQVRVLRRDPPALTAEVLSDAFMSSGAAQARIGAWQSFAEFRLGRAELFAGRAGGLRDASAERDFKTGFNAHPWDEFENPLRAGQPFPGTNQAFAPRETCFACHGLPGVYSFNSFFNFRNSDTQGGKTRRPAVLSEVPISDATAAAVKWKEGRPNWAALRKLLAE